MHREILEEPNALHMYHEQQWATAARTANTTGTITSISLFFHIYLYWEGKLCIRVFWVDTVKCLFFKCHDQGIVILGMRVLLSFAKTTPAYSWA